MQEEVTQRTVALCVEATKLSAGAIQPNFLCSQRLLNVSLSFTGSCVIVNLRCLPYEG